jgi:outer membrane receptor protein involved in Fe transport
MTLLTAKEIRPRRFQEPSVNFWRRQMKSAHSATWLAAVLTAAFAAHAQTSRGTVSGTVTDPTGALVPHVSVTLTHSETGVRRPARTNEAGIYRFDAVDLGVYELNVAQPGFNAFVATRLGVEANRTTVLDVKLEVGSEATAVRVSAEAEEMTVRDSPLRGGNFLASQVSRLPLIGLSPISLALTLPGVIQPSGGKYWGQAAPEATMFSVNGQRIRGNNYLLDGAENNDIEYAGVAQPFNIADAVEEVSAQTANFSVEFGRAAGGVINVVTKSGTNSVHGTAFWRYQSQRFNSVSNLDKLNGIPKSVFVHNLPGFTVGGPIRKGKTFFFAGFQQDTLRSTGSFPLRVPTAAAADRLRSLFPSNPRLDLYLNNLGDLRGTAAPITLALGVDPRTGLDRGSVQFATAPLSLPSTNEGPEWLVRLDHYWSEAHRLSWRYIYDSRSISPSTYSGVSLVSFPGFFFDSGDRNQNFLFTDSYTFGPSYTNEFRFSYGRLDADANRISSRAVPLARTLPQITITNIAAPGISSNALEGRQANNVLFQETQTKLSGRHIFRYGAELLRQFATQLSNANSQGLIAYGTSPGYSALANFLDDFSGQSGDIRRTIGADIFHPDSFRQSYFFQDAWKTTPSLTLTLGLRYENFGQPVNALRYPAFTGFDPNLFFKPNHVNTDNKDFGPAFGLAWSPSFSSGWLGTLFGDHKTVWRGGYQISYQELYTQIISLDLATATPNAITIDQVSRAPGRGDANWFAQLPAATPRPPSLLDTQYGTLEKNFRNPYTERWSFGFQRQLRGQALLDVSYIGAESHKLTTRADLNPLQPSGLRLHPDFGGRTVRTSEGNSAYHSLQARLDRRFSHGFQFATSYTWSKSLDSTSEGIGQVNTQGTSANVTSVPIAQGGLKLDRGLSDFHRGHRLTLLYLWEIPGPSKGVAKHVLSGWSIAGITTFQSGTPYTMKNSTDRNRDGWPADRPDISNRNAPINSRAQIWPTTGPQGCSTGYRNLDTNVCTSPADVYWVEGVGFPNASTVGRNTMFTNGTNNFDASLFKSFAIAERRRLEFRWEAQNAFNHPQFVQPPERNLVNSPAGRFLNRDFTDSGIRSMWVQVKLIF